MTTVDDVQQSAVRLRKIASDILDVAESISIDEGYISHFDTINITAVVVRGVLMALVANNNKNFPISYYRNAFMESLDHVCEVKA